MCQLGSCLLEGHCTEYWQEILKKAAGHGTGDSAFKGSKVIKLIQPFNKLCLTKNAIDLQKNAMKTVEMYYYELDYQKVAKQIL